MYEDNDSNFKVSSLFFASLSLILVSVALLVYFLLPSDKTSEAEEIVTITNFSEETEEDFSAAFQDYFSEYTVKKLNDNTDTGLILYRQPLSKAAVEWFYCQITGNREVAVAILEQADANDIPLSLAFALAHTESTFNARAINRNTNNSIDRGLFQLNSNSFPGLNETDFYDANISAKYGLSHLKFCLGYAGTEVSALAMYNAGTGRVRSNKTPQSTLNYVGKIITYQKMLESLFADEVEAYYETRLLPGVTVAIADKR